MTSMTDLVQDYEKHGFNQRLGFGESPALLVVDFVNAYVLPESPMYAGVEHTVEPGSRLLEAARAADVPVIFTQVVLSPGGGANAGVFRRKVKALEIYEGHTELGRIVEELVPRDGEVVLEKQYASAFFGTSLSSMLAANRIDTLIIIGYSTSGCIRATAVDTVQHGYIPIVVRECVGDRDPRPHEQALFDINAKYGDVVSLDEALSYLEGYVDAS